MTPRRQLAASVACALALSIEMSAALAGPAPAVRAANHPNETGVDPVTTGPAASAAAGEAPARPQAGERAPLVAAVGVAAADETEHDAHAEQAAGRAPMPFDIIRSLQFLQDQVARGNDRAIRVQSLLLRRFGPSFLDAADTAWEDARNRRAAVLFVLSGGPPQILDGLLKRGVLPEDERMLFEGALAYVRNDLKVAGERLAGVDLAHVEPGLAGHINLVLGQILEDEDPAAAMRHLDQARLLAPGGLIEESALRMGVLIVEKLSEPTRADQLARQYLDRYHRSSYAGNFEARFVAGQAKRGGGDAAAAIAAMADVIGGLPDERRQRLFLAVARRALVEGHQAFAGLSAGAALAIAPLGEGDRERGRLYELASRVTTRGIDAQAASRELEAIDRTLLHPEDLPLLDGARHVLSAIETIGVPLAAAPVVETEPSMETASLPVIDRAMRVLGEIEGELRENQ